MVLLLSFVLGCTSNVACPDATTASECVGAGGTWEVLGNSATQACNCPTGDAGVACTGTGDCEGGCYAADTAGCASVTEGTCAEWTHTGGCGCTVDPAGSAVVCE